MQEKKHRLKGEKKRKKKEEKRREKGLPAEKSGEDRRPENIKQRVRREEETTKKKWRM